MKTTDYQRHPLSAKFGEIPGAYLDELAEDIQKHGQQDPGVTLDGKILDGWHRYLACIRAGVEFESKPFKGKDPGAFVLSKNLHRRHMILNGSQRAMLVVSVHEWRGSGFIGEKQDSHSKPAPGAGLGASESQMAAEARVGERTIQQAKIVEANGSHELKEAVRGGDISLKDAEPIARKPKSRQAKAIGEAKKPKAEKKPKPLAHEVEGAKVKGLVARIVELEAEIAELKEKNDELAEIASTVDSIENDTVVKDMQVLRLELRSVKQRRDGLMGENRVMKQHIGHLQKELKKCKDGK